MCNNKITITDIVYPCTVYIYIYLYSYSAILYLCIFRCMFVMSYLLYTYVYVYYIYFISLYGWWVLWCLLFFDLVYVCNSAVCDMELQFPPREPPKRDHCLVLCFP